MRHRQAGITMIGWIVLLTPLAIVLYAGIRLAPFYLNHMKVVKALDQTAQEFKGDSGASAQLIRNSLARRFDTDIEVRKSGSGWDLATDYEQVVPLVANVQLLVVFQKHVTTSGSDSMP
jgi:hypothetical protein